MTLDDLKKTIEWAEENWGDMPPTVLKTIGELLAEKQREMCLTTDEFNAVYDWLNREKDTLPSPLKEALVKLVNNEEKRRIA